MDDNKPELSVASTTASTTLDQSDDGVAENSCVTMNECQAPVSKKARTCSTDHHDLTDESPKDSLDIAQTLGLNPGVRIRVLWDIYKDDNGNDAEQDPPIQHWWGATLLPYSDGRTFVLSDEDEGSKDFEVLPLRQLEYDACPELGFPDRSIEDVCFLTDCALFNVSTDDTTSWRMESADGIVCSEPLVSIELPDDNNPDEIVGEEDRDDEISVSSSSPQDGLRAVITTILQSAMVKSGVMDKMSKLPSAQQLVMAERIAASKEKLIQKMEEQVAGDGTAMNGRILVTPEHVRKCMEELRQELNM
jgi:hypothetical protein